MAASVRICARCHSEKPIEAFPIKDKARGTRRSYCLPCCREYGKEHYRRNRPVYLRRTQARNTLIRPDRRAFIVEYFRTHPCVDCGIADPVVLEFDHREPSAKIAAVGHLMHTASFADLQVEIAKCDVRCGNCHRRKTLLQFGSYRVSMGTAGA